MKSLISFLAVCIFVINTLNAQFSVTVSNPHFNVNSRTHGIITDPEITISPTGAYARVEIMFKINPQPTYNVTDSLEAVLLFDLPDGSFINDSWLWLDDQNIIRAEVVEKDRAIAIYEGIVKRRRDPSLLVKTGGNSYQLNVYPMTTAYPRKVKLTYLTPLKFQQSRATVEMPTKLFAASKVLNDVSVKIKHNTEFTSPSIVEDDYSKYYKSSSGGEDQLLMKGVDYKSGTFTVAYNINSTDLKMYTYKRSQTESVYQLIVPPATFGAAKPTNTVIVLDHATVGSAIYSLEEIKQYLVSSLLNNYSNIDSFNVFYEHNGSIVQVFSDWQAISNSAIDNSIKKIPNGISGSSSKYEDLIKEALTFCATKPGTDAQVILISNGLNYTTNQHATDVLFNNVKTHLGGQFKNKIHIVSYSVYTINFTGKQYSANEIWYNKLVLASGGTSHKYLSVKMAYVNGVNKAVYDLNIPSLLTLIADNHGFATSSYNVNIAVNNGFTYSSYNLSPVNRLNPSKYYVETGLYNGDIVPGNNVNIQIAGGVPINTTHSLTNVYSSDSGAVASWTYHFLNDLIGKNNSVYAQEIIDSSINSRVLCDYTAFLAVEDGDTIHTNKNDNPGWILHVDQKLTKKEQLMECYPNPFSDKLVIEFDTEVQLLEIFDITGRKVLSVELMGGQKSYTWNGNGSNGNSMPSGVYVIIASTPTERFVTKAVKQ